MSRAYHLVRRQHMTVVARSAQEAVALAGCFPGWASDDPRIDMSRIDGASIPFGEVTAVECDEELDAWSVHQAQEVDRHVFGGAA